MSKIIYHKGTGTYFGLDDDVVVIDLDRIPEKIDAEVMDTEGDEIAIYWGEPLILCPTNVMDFSPKALRDEAGFLYEENPTDEDFKWVAENATDEELTTLGSYILNDDELWQMFRDKVVHGFHDRTTFFK